MTWILRGHDVYLTPNGILHRMNAIRLKINTQMINKFTSLPYDLKQTWAAGGLGPRALAQDHERYLQFKRFLALLLFGTIGFPCSFYQCARLTISLHVLMIEKLNKKHALSCLLEQQKRK